MEGIWIVFLFLLGACVGSFLNVVVWRVPRGESIVFPGSHCPSCGRGILWFDNIPLLSWILLRARCRFCKVKISIRYFLIEAATAGLFVGLYVVYFDLHVRSDVGSWASSWPMYAAHLALLCGLLACSLVDAACWIVPLELCWFVSGVGIFMAAAFPDSVGVPAVPPRLGAATLGAAGGLGVALFLLRRRWILPSFLDAEDPPESAEDSTPTQVAYTSASGVRPRVEILRELLFLLPVLIGAAGAWGLVSYCPSVRDAWERLFALGEGRVGLHLNGLLGAVFGYFIGGLWVWGMRILGTLGFGKEAMGLGDVHLMAAVGAVGGWIVPSVAFFLAPIFGLLWALYLMFRKGRHELPYGPWLSLASGAVLVFYDQFEALGRWYFQIVRGG